MDGEIEKRDDWIDKMGGWVDTVNGLIDKMNWNDGWMAGADGRIIKIDR